MLLREHLSDLIQSQTYFGEPSSHSELAVCQTVQMFLRLFRIGSMRPIRVGRWGREGGTARRDVMPLKHTSRGKLTFELSTTPTRAQTIKDREHTYRGKQKAFG